MRRRQRSSCKVCASAPGRPHLAYKNLCVILEKKSNNAFLGGAETSDVREQFDKYKDNMEVKMSSRIAQMF